MGSTYGLEDTTFYFCWYDGRMRYLGIDYGSGKVGVALSDEAGTMGFPHATLKNDSKLLEALLKIVRDQTVGTVVIGESRSSSGEENPVAKAARTLAAKLEAEGVSVAYEMEAFSTQEARRLPDGSRTNTASLDASAAALVLTSYLSRTHGND